RAMLGLFPADRVDKAVALIEQMGLPADVLGRRVSKLSGGQQQRVGIARAFMLDPVIVLADEPVASLDPKISRDVLASLRRESRENGTTVLCSLHDVAMAREFADRIVALRAGVIAFDGAPAALDEQAIETIYGSPCLTLH